MSNRCLTLHPSGPARKAAQAVHFCVRGFLWLTIAQNAIDLLSPAHPTALSVDLLSMKSIRILKLVCLALSWRHA